MCLYFFPLHTPKPFWLENIRYVNLCMEESGKYQPVPASCNIQQTSTWNFENCRSNKESMFPHLLYICIIIYLFIYFTAGHTALERYAWNNCNSTEGLLRDPQRYFYMAGQGCSAESSQASLPIIQGRWHAGVHQASLPSPAPQLAAMV